MLTLLLYFLVTVLVVAVGFTLKLFVRFDSKFNEVCKKIPGPSPIPIFGNTFQFTQDPEKLLPIFDEWAEKYGHRLIYRVGTYYIVSLSNPKDVEKILTSTTETVKSVDYDMLIPWLGTGLLVSNGEKWSKRRKLLTPAFHFKILERFLEVFNQQSFRFVEVIQRKFKEHVEVFDVCPIISKLALDIICETAMGVKINALEQEHESDYIEAITRIKYLQTYRAFRPWLEPSLVWNLFSYGEEEKRLIKILHRFTNQVIQQRKQEISHEGSSSNIGEKKRSAFLDLLLEAQRSGEACMRSDEDVREETDTFMFEGHDTVSTGIAFTLFLIGNHPDVQSKICAELESVFGNDRERPVTMQDLGRLKYLECCIKESLRLCPSVPIIARSLQNNFQLDDEVILPPDTLVLILPYQLHRNPEVFDNPLMYRPERFLHENSANRHPFAFVPFSAGSRGCIGQKFALMEEKVILANILRNFTIRSSQKWEELVLLTDLILHSKHGIKICYSCKS